MVPVIHLVVLVQEVLVEEAEAVLIQDNRVLVQLDMVQAEAAEDLVAAEAVVVRVELL